MGALIAVAAAGVISAGVSAYSAHQQGKAAQQAGDASYAFAQQSAAKRAEALRKLLQSGAFEFEAVDAVGEARKALGWNVKAAPALNKLAGSFNKAAAQSFDEVMNIAFGHFTNGQSAFDAQRTGVNDVVASQLRGEVSEGTSRILGRAAVSSGAAGLGPQAVRQLYTGYLGLTAEQQTQQGVGNFASLTQMYRGAIPMTTGAQLLPYGGLSTAEAIQTAQFNSAGEFNANIAKAQAILGGVDAEQQIMGAGFQAQQQGNMAKVAADGQMYQSIAQGIGAVAGAYASYSTSPALSSGFQGYNQGLPVYSQMQLGSQRPSDYFYNSGGSSTRVARATPVYS